MSLRIRTDGRVLCAAMHKWQPGDQYLDDSISERLTGATGMAPMLVTEPMDVPDGAGRGGHRVHGEWWWVDSVPDDVKATVDWAGHPQRSVDPGSVVDEFPTRSSLLQWMVDRGWVVSNIVGTRSAIELSLPDKTLPVSVVIRPWPLLDDEELAKIVERVQALTP